MDFLLGSFPANWKFSFGDTLDNFIKKVARDHAAFFDIIRDICVFTLDSIENLLMAIPWWLLIFIICFAGYKLKNKKSTGIMFGIMLTLIGSFGLWSYMMETLSMIIVSVSISLILGLPIGIAIAMNENVKRITRPVLDLMQTMPSWVYLVPAVMFFSVGKTPALMATVIYSIVPFIRMTSHGISYVDKEVVEAATAFGSTPLQTLIKVQIPQAMPTIMTGVNQTIMLAMSMVVTCALIGANGLGMELLVAVNRSDMLNSLLSGFAIVFIAIILDRLTQGLVKKSEVNLHE